MDMVDQRSRRGYCDWFVQRITALLSGIYAVFLIIFLLIHHPISYAQWHSLFTHLAMKIFTLLVIFSVLWHAWIGMWTIFTDYVKNKPTRLALETIVCLLLVAYFIWAIEFLWIVR
ncbi:succinate dehydrogenase, hydrophobic membrane anchor protein [Coxiella-like endosymbiont]|uniref:succinate dehydrogenase, hydrophobic membrane anchor protein n=1 Tax=Coxiella-like endosymbiont TaxID=1592897 RepID=UPI0027296848|nr:succinate dehydrogenase, hydrophobic membrane anchor protein [Coxiella-like endosymbiont]